LVRWKWNFSDCIGVTKAYNNEPMDSIT
jgi:hypothetical protein